jgi:clathrin heavy chain
MAAPIRFQEVAQLTALGIQPASISFTNLTLESDKYICVREAPEGQPASVVILDLSNPGQAPVRRPITADSAIMNPSANILALKAGNQLQVFNMDTKTKLKAHAIEEQVVFWKWISNNTIGMVTAGAVYHWSLDGPDAPQKVFDRNPALAACQIINYRADHEQKWFCLVGIEQRDGRRSVVRIRELGESFDGEALVADAEGSGD